MGRGLGRGVFMKISNCFLGWILISIMISQPVFAQESPNIIEEESAEVFLEEYTDEFQETFFEALKQKGIQNYDRAINLLLECKQLDGNNNAVNHQLAKTYFLDKKYIPAQQYAVEALISEPGNYWILANLVEIMEKQGIPFQSVQGSIPFENKELKSNLAQMYFGMKKYGEAKNILLQLENNQGNTLLLQKISDSLTLKDTKNGIAGRTGRETSVESSDTNELENLRGILEKLKLKNDTKALEKKATEALENYPLQPDFYYYRGVALNGQGRHQEAIMVLEEGLNYLFENDHLANTMYKELAKAYKSLGNDSKANGYLSKVKPGFQ